jgi:gluconolactonase
MYEAEPLVRRATSFGFTEGPVWHSGHGALIFSDIPGDCIWRLDPATDEVTVYRRPSNKANGNTLDREQRLVTCEHGTSRVVREEADGTLTVIADRYGGIELNSPNDVVVDSGGRILFTDPPYGRLPVYGVKRPPAQPVQGVYRVDPADGSIVRLADDFDRPNGLCLAAGETVLFVNDSARKHIRRFELHGDEIRGGEVWAELTGPEPGAPDGMKVDSAGNLFCCGPGGLHVFSREGDLLGVIRVPERTGNFEWGDGDGRTLYVCATTSIYSLRVQVPGLSAP